MYSILMLFEMLRVIVGVLSHLTVAATAGALQHKLLHLYVVVGRARSAAYQFPDFLTLLVRLASILLLIHRIS
jgi:hypothetical protein